MTPRMRRSPETIFKHVFLIVILLGILSIVKSAYEASTSSQSLFSRRSLLKRDLECRIVHSQPDQCSFVKENCPDEEAGLLSYLRLYFCSLPGVKPLAFIILAVWISVLFSTIGIAASDFLCLNLSTIATIMGMSESLAGVTFLAFGNGSPDVFSTFAAFSSHSGSLAVGELMGAAGFISAVVAGSMAITKPFRVAKKAFVRDVSLFTIAATFSLNFLKDGSLRMWECIVMIGFYASYVFFVVAWHWWFDRRRRIRLAESAARLHQHIPDQQELDVPEVDDDEESRPAAERTPLIRTESGASISSVYTPGTPAWVANNVDEEDDETRDQYLAALSNNMRIARPGRERRSTITPIRPSLIGALEFRSVLSALEKKSTNAQPIHMRRYSDDGRHMLEQTTETPSMASQPALSSDHPPEMGVKRSPTHLNGRNRATSAGDAWSLGVDRDLLDAHTGTPETAIYSPVERARPKAVASDSQQDVHTTLLSPQSYQSPAQHLLLSPSAISSGSATPSSTTAVRNGFLAPPDPAFHRPEYNADENQHSDGASVVSNGPSPFALVPKLQIPQPGHRQPQELRFVSSPSEISSTHSRPPSIHLPPPSMSPVSTHRPFPLPEDQVPQLQVKWWPYNYLPAPDVLFATLFPGLWDWSQKRWPEKILAVCTAPSIFLLTISVPVVESKNEDEEFEETTLATPISGTHRRSLSTTTVLILPSDPSHDARTRSHNNIAVPQITTTDEDTVFEPGHKQWNRWLACVQAFTAPMFVVFIVWVNLDDKSDKMLLVKMILGSLVFSLVALGFLLTFTGAGQEPRHRPIVCFMGFFVAIAWISTIAGEVVGVLKAFGVILNISDAILGLTIFAVGNSLGDLVADITVARLGYPMMALSACFGGPMLNILLGIGIGGLYQTIMNARHHYHQHPDRPIHYKPYELDISTTLLISGATLLVTLLFLLIVVPLNNWRMDRKIGIGLIAIWAISTIINVVLEVLGIGQTE